MKKFDFVVKEKVGIHARPAIMLVKVISVYKSEVSIEKDGKSADAKKLMPIMGLGVKYGDKVVFTIEGPDEETATVEIKEFCDKNL